MKTNINKTYETLCGHYLMSDNTINTEYLNDAIELWAMNTQKLYDAVVNSNRKMTSIVWETFIDLTNDQLKNEGYKCECMSYQLKKWLNEYGNGYETLNAAVEALTEERQAE